jgi:hypothetical protein
MRNISFSLTTDQIRAKTKTVTRRLGWHNLKPGTLLQACVKCMGLKPGEKIQKLAVIRVVAVEREPLEEITVDDVRREGFDAMTPDEFIKVFCEHMGVDRFAEVTRIEFEYEDCK